MRSVLITGCNRGLGLGLVRQLLKVNNPPDHIIATCRNKEQAVELNKLADENKNIKIFEIDINDHDNLNTLAEYVEGIVKEDGLNILVNNAGVSSKFTRIGLVKAQQMHDNFKTNAVAPLMLSKALLPLLKKASKKNSSSPIGMSRAAIINVTSVLGSIQNNDIGGFYPYRCSKAALNAITKSLSIDLRDDNILVVSIHPGWCKTDMGGPNAPLEVDVAMKQLVQTLNGLSEKDNGTFIGYDGAPLPW